MNTLILSYLMIWAIFSAPVNPAEWAFLIIAIVAGLVVLVALVWTVIKLLKDGKLDQLKEAIIVAIKEAEKTHQSGATKKEIVVKTVKEFCDQIGLNVNEKLLSWIADYIDKYIADHNELEEIEEKNEAKEIEAKENEAEEVDP